MAKRKKKRTHVKPDEAAIAKVPKSFVIKVGPVGRSLAHLVKDVRRAMEPNTAMNLRERKGNKLKDFVAVASQLSVTHLLLFSRTAAGVNLRIGRLPRGPTLTFRVTSYGLSTDVLALQNRPKSPGFEFKTAPLVVLNGFGGDDKHVKLMATMFQNMFPPIQVQTMKLADARRVILFNLNKETNEVEFRHYTISVKVTGVSKSVKTIIQTDVPDLGRYNDISDYILKGAFASESDVEDAGESTVTLSQKYIGKGNRQAEQRAIRLVEMGPRIQLSLLKIQAGLCEGEVIYHSIVQKTPAQVKEQECRLQKANAERARRRAEQEKNVAAKKQAEGGDNDDDAEEAEEEEDDDDDAMDVDEDEGDEE
ncbi:Brix domain-containing protein [Fimicolochytrium jonesii]|uniref:Brix domain-containing protein n=1 Tax=Fimicolochytrium jonesii TaxID=1396493 RepID=UPI0022FE046B|nr:Brix domain-containing protein [Fimicolochytrium jonesii]KAI8827085.1 Brix domain-containing protein [Fimicolochytrium jonesii]